MLDESGGLRDVHDCYGIVFADEQLEAFKTDDTSLGFLGQGGQIAGLDGNCSTRGEGDAVLKV